MTRAQNTQPYLDDERFVALLASHVAAGMVASHGTDSKTIAERSINQALDIWTRTGEAMHERMRLRALADTGKARSNPADDRAPCS